MYCKQQFKFCMGIFGVPQDFIWFKYMENQELKKILDTFYIPFSISYTRCDGNDSINVDDIKSINYTHASIHATPVKVKLEAADCKFLMLLYYYITFFDLINNIHDILEAADFWRGEGWGKNVSPR